MNHQYHQYQLGIPIFSRETASNDKLPLQEQFELANQLKIFPLTEEQFNEPPSQWDKISRMGIYRNNKW